MRVSVGSAGLIDACCRLRERQIPINHSDPAAPEQSIETITYCLSNVDNNLVERSDIDFQALIALQHQRPPTNHCHDK
jgi:hypothetical protein